MIVVIASRTSYIVTISVHRKIQVVAGHEPVLDRKLVFIPNVVRVQKREITAAGRRDANVPRCRNPLILIHVNKAGSYAVRTGGCDSLGLLPIIAAIVDDDNLP